MQVARPTTRHSSENLRLKGSSMDRDILLALIADSYRRMATNNDSAYRATQIKRCQEWLAALTALYEKDPAAYSA